jgi:hypothetical protein
MSLLKDASGTTFTGPGGSAITINADDELLDIVTIDDLTFDGGYNLVGHQNTGSNLAVRWRDTNGDPVVGREPTASDVRHFLIFAASQAGAATAWHLIEYKEVSAKSTSVPTLGVFGSWPGYPTLTETRRWFNWHNYDAVAAAFPGHMGDTMNPSSMRWEPGTTASNGRLWFTWVQVYPDGAQPFANIQYVVLDDAEARAAGATSGVEVSSGNRPKYLYYKDTGSSWKKATSGLTEIPSARQADFGGNQFLFAGSNQGNISNGARGVSLSAVPAFPTSSPTLGSTILASSTLIFDTGSNSTASVVNMWRPPNMAPFPGYNLPNTTMHIITSGGSYSAASLTALPLGVGDCVYFLEATGGNDVVNVRMATGASGGSFVIERYNGSSWVEPGDLAIHLGDRAMTGTHNVFYFDSVATSTSTPHASMGAAKWWRLRRTIAGSSGGTTHSIYCTDSPDVGSPGHSNGRDFSGTYVEDHADAVAAYNADPENYHGYAYAPDMVDGTAFVRTNAVEGVVCAGRFSSRASWYGASTLFARPDINTGVPVHHVDSVEGINNGNGNWASGAYIWYFFVFDPDHLAEAYANTRSRDADGVHPVAYYQVRDHFTLAEDQQIAADNVDYPGPNDRQLSMNQALHYDPVHKQLIYMWHRGGGTNPLLYFWSVRDA